MIDYITLEFIGKKGLINEYINHICKATNKVINESYKMIKNINKDSDLTEFLISENIDLINFYKTDLNFINQFLFNSQNSQINDKIKSIEYFKTNIKEQNQQLREFLNITEY